MISYDLGTSQPIFIWIKLREYIRENSITLEDIKKQADEIVETIKQCGDGTVPDYVLEGFDKLKRKRRPDTLDKEMQKFGKVLGRDFYADIMKTIEWQFDRRTFKSKVLFPFLYGRYPSWNTKKKRKTMMHYFLKKFPAVYCVLWRMRRFTEILRDFHRMTTDKVPYPKIKKHIDDTYRPADFPKDMQRREAQMFFDVIVPKIDQPLVTIHDSIVVEAGKKCNVAKIIKQAFQELHQIKVRVSCEFWYE